MRTSSQSNNLPASKDSFAIHPFQWFAEYGVDTCDNE